MNIIKLSHLNDILYAADTLKIIYLSPQAVVGAREITRPSLANRNKIIIIIIII